jgi:hypothetical protein
MASFGGVSAGRTQIGTKVWLNVYDLHPANDYLCTVGFGLHHSGVEIQGSEYSFASGAGIYDSGTPQVAPGAKLRERIDMGQFEGGSAQLKKALEDLRDHFGSVDYNLIQRNCNHFSNALVWKLVGKKIPGHVNRLSDFGVCCSCLLPRSLLVNAPVGDPNGQQGFSSGSRQRLFQQTNAFTGSGMRLRSKGNTESKGLLSKLAGNDKGRNSPDDLIDRREKARRAALARLELSQQGEVGKHTQQ